MGLPTRPDSTNIGQAGPSDAEAETSICDTVRLFYMIEHHDIDFAQSLGALTRSQSQEPVLSFGG